MVAIFEPQLMLFREPDGEYTLNAVTITPNSCYGAGVAERGIPPNVRLLPEVESILLNITLRSGPCLQVLRPVRHHIGNLRLGPSEGKTTLTAFAMVRGAVVGVSSLDVSHLGCIQKGAGKGAPMPIDTSDWYAWVNRMPPGPPSLHVRGVVTMPDPGYDVTLKPAAQQGMNTRDLVLDLNVARRPGMWIQVVTEIPVSYEIRNYTGNHRSVLIQLPDGSAIPLDLTDVH